MLTGTDNINDIGIGIKALYSSNLVQSAVEFFDGSTIVDPVVVSSVFWNRIQKNIVSLLLGQLLATVAFAVFTSVASSQLSRVADSISKNVFRENVDGSNGSKLDGDVQNRSRKIQSPTTMATPDYTKLILCLVIDTIGTSSELIPFFGELTDVAWAPIAALALRSLFAQSNVVFALEFAEEFLPFTDVLPLASICWYLDTYMSDSNLAKVLQIGQYGTLRKDAGGRNSSVSDNVIDVSNSVTGKDENNV